MNYYIEKIANFIMHPITLTVIAVTYVIAKILYPWLTSHLLKAGLICKCCLKEFKDCKNIS